MMANVENEQADDQTAKEALMASLIDAFKANRNALRFLPDMMEELIAVQSNSFPLFDDEYKTTLLKRGSERLKEKVKSLEYHIETKDKRINAQADIISNQKKHIDALSNNSKGDRNEKLILELQNKEERLAEQAEKIFSLERKLLSMKEINEKKQNQSSAMQDSNKTIKERNDDLIREIQMKEEEVKKQAERNDDLIREIQMKEEEVKKQAERFRQLEEQHKSVVRNKEREIKDLNCRNEALKQSFEAKSKEVEDQAERPRNDGLVLDNNGNLKEQAERFRKAQEQHISVLQDKEKKIEDLIKRNEELTRDLKDNNGQMKEQSDRLEHLTQKSNTVLFNKDKEIEQLKSRIASLSEKRVKQDQSKVEDTLSMNRQSTLEQDYKNFIDEARVDVCDTIQSHFQSQQEIDVHIYHPRLACLIFEAAFERMKEAKEAFIEFSKEVSRSMIHSATEMSQQVTLTKKARHSYFKVYFTINISRQESPFHRDVLDAVMLALKETAHSCNLDLFVKDVQDKAFQKWQKWYGVEKMIGFRPSEYLLHERKMILYIKKCIRLTWQMVTQVPALKIEYNSQYLGKNHKKMGYHSHPDMQANTSTPQASGEEIACYLWPGLLDGNGRPIVAGEVLCKTKTGR